MLEEGHGAGSGGPVRRLRILVIIWPMSNAATPGGAASEATASPEAGGPTTAERLVEAAADVFSEQGYDGVRVQDIARRAGLTTGAIYANFRNKAGLLLQTITAVTTAHLGGAERTADDGATAADDLVEPVNDATSKRGRRARALLLEAFVAARRDTEVRQLLRQRLNVSTRRLTERVDRAKADGDIDEELDTRSVVRLLQALRFGIASLETVDTAMPAEDAWRQLST